MNVIHIDSPDKSERLTIQADWSQDTPDDPAIIEISDEHLQRLQAFGGRRSLVKEAMELSYHSDESVIGECGYAYFVAPSSRPARTFWINLAA